MESLFSLLPKEIEIKESEFKNWRDELVKKAVIDINLIRASQNWEYKDKTGKMKKLEPETADALARRINMNPFLAKANKDGELAYILGECEKKRSYSHLYFLLK